MLKSYRYFDAHDRLKIDLVAACCTIEIKTDVGFTCVLIFI